MDPETGKLVVSGITVVGALVWLLGLTVMLRAARERRQPDRPIAERYQVDEASPPGSIGGEVDIEGGPDDLSTRLASQLARESMFPFGSLKITRRERDLVSFEPTGAPINGFRSGRVWLEPKGAQTRLTYLIETSPRPVLLGGWIFLTLGLAELVLVPWLMFAFVLPSPNPSIRGQALQSLQMGHFLWPPFLFAHLSRQPARVFRGRMEALIHNLPYT